jgi:hypothetical protein
MHQFDAEAEVCSHFEKNYRKKRRDKTMMGQGKEGMEMAPPF